MTKTKPLSIAQNHQTHPTQAVLAGALYSYIYSIFDDGPQGCHCFDDEPASSNPPSAKLLRTVSASALQKELGAKQQEGNGPKLVDQAKSAPGIQPIETYYNPSGRAAP